MMQNMQYRTRLHQKRGAVILLCLLVLVVVGALYWFKNAYGPVHPMGSSESDIEVPWRQWDEIQTRVQDGQPPGGPHGDQLQLPQPLTIVTSPVEDGQRRGELNFAINPGGQVYGQWTGQFHISKEVDYQIMGCKFEGLTDPEQLYSDEQGDDPSRLFFIAKGRFIILETNDGNGKVRNLMGHVYIRGWLRRDHAISGELFLTTDEKNFLLYTWSKHVQ